MSSVAVKELSNHFKYVTPLKQENTLCFKIGDCLLKDVVVTKLLTCNNTDFTVGALWEM